MNKFEIFKGLISEALQRVNVTEENIKKHSEHINSLRQEYNDLIIEQEDAKAEKVLKEIEKAQQALEQEKEKLEVIKTKTITDWGTTGTVKANSKITAAAEAAKEELLKQLNDLQGQFEKEETTLIALKEEYQNKLQQTKELYKQGLAIARKIGEANKYIPGKENVYQAGIKIDNTEIKNTFERGI